MFLLTACFKTLVSTRKGFPDLQAECSMGLFFDLKTVLQALAQFIGDKGQVCVHWASGLDDVKDVHNPGVTIHHNRGLPGTKVSYCYELPVIISGQ